MIEHKINILKTFNLCKYYVKQAVGNFHKCLLSVLRLHLLTVRRELFKKEFCCSS